MTFLKQIISALDAITHKINVAFRSTAMVFLMMMLAIIVTNVFSRYLARFGYEWAGAIHWAEEVTKFLMIWLAYLVLPTAHKNGLNVSVDFAIAIFKGKRIGFIIRFLIEILICILLLKGLELSWGFMIKGASKYSLALHIKMIYVYTIIPASLFTTLLVSTSVLLRLFVSIVDGKDHFTPLKELEN